MDRLYALVEELRAVAPRYRSVPSLAEHCEVSTRTIERDLSALQQPGVPIYATPGRRGGWAIDFEHTLPPFNLSAGGVAAIATAWRPPDRPRSTSRAAAPHGGGIVGTNGEYPSGALFNIQVPDGIFGLRTAPAG